MNCIRIAVLSAYDEVCTFLDNSITKAMHYWNDELHTYLKGHFDRLIPGLEFQLESMTIGSLLSLWFQTLVVGLTMNILSICIFLVTYGRMIEIYVVTALGPIPLATMGSSEWRSTGQNYLKSLLALGFQAFLIMIVVGIYAVLIRNISGAADIAGAIWGCMGYTVLLCFCLFKTGSISKSVFGAH